MNATKLLFALLFVAGTVAASDLYKWTDEKGIVHYSDTPPPPNVFKTQRVHIEGGVTHDSDTAVQDGVKKDPQADAKPEPPKPPPLVQETPEFRARLCDQSKANLELLQSKFAVADAQGKPLDEKSRAEFTQRSQAAVATNCSSGAH